MTLQTKMLQLEPIQSHTYTSESLTGRMILNLLLFNKEIFEENIVSYIGVIEYPSWLGGKKEIIHMNKTTVGLSYNNQDLDIPTARVRIDGRENDIIDTKSILERLLNIELERQ